MNHQNKIYVAGHRGMVGSAIYRLLQDAGYSNLIGKTSTELDLTQQSDVNHFFDTEKPDYVFLAAAKVGGILANDTYSAEFLYKNLMIQNNVIHAAYQNNVKKLLFLGSSCIYPKEAKQPIKEEYLLSGYLEPTNEAYAIAKITGIKLCEMYCKQYNANYISVMPSNIYGPGDNYHLKNSHVLPAFIRKFHEAKIENKDNVEVWGSGIAQREFIYVDDVAHACIFLMNNTHTENIFNIGIGKDLTIKELANLIKQIIGFKGNIVWNKDYPDGTPRKLLDISKLKQLGWQWRIKLEEGINLAYQDFLLNSHRM